jgi:hypothetical protein
MFWAKVENLEDSTFLSFCRNLPTQKRIRAQNGTRPNLCAQAFVSPQKISASELDKTRIAFIFVLRKAAKASFYRLNGRGCRTSTLLFSNQALSKNASRGIEKASKRNKLLP